MMMETNNITDILYRRTKPIPAGYSYFVKTTDDYVYSELDYPFCSFSVNRVAAGTYQITSGTGPQEETLEGIYGDSVEKFEAFLVSRPKKELVHALNYPFESGYTWDVFIASFYANPAVLGVGIMQHTTATFTWLTKEDSQTTHAYQLCDLHMQAQSAAMPNAQSPNATPRWIQRLFT